MDVWRADFGRDCRCDYQKAERVNVAQPYIEGNRNSFNSSCYLQVADITVDTVSHNKQGYF
jgi:hypothetical protein